MTLNTTPSSHSLHLHTTNRHSCSELALSAPKIMAHTSVASKRLFQEYKALLTAPPDGITAGPVNEDDLFVWEALIQGPEGTPFEGGIFPAELKFPKDYPLNPPKMKFLGEIWYEQPDCIFKRF
jgi:hypothetical protein